MLERGAARSAEDSSRDMVLGFTHVLGNDDSASQRKRVVLGSFGSLFHGDQYSRFYLHFT